MSFAQLRLKHGKKSDCLCAGNPFHFGFLSPFRTFEEIQFAKTPCYGYSKFNDRRFKIGV